MTLNGRKSKKLLPISLDEDDDDIIEEPEHIKEFNYIFRSLMQQFSKV